MNHFTKYLLQGCAALVVMTMLNSCDSFLNQQNPNRIPAETYFQDENDILRALNGVYYSLRSQYLLGEGTINWTEERSDNMGRLDNQSDSGEPFQFTDYDLSSTNRHIRKHWTAHNQGINRANFVLKGLEEVEFEDQTLKSQYRAEALFLRALIYYHAVRKWGDLPLVTKYVSTPEEISEVSVRRDKKEVYDLIVSDLTLALKEAERGKLPNLQSAGGKGRASKAAICGLLGEVYLTMHAEFPGDPKRADFASDAKKYLKQCWEMRPFERIEDIPYADVFDVHKKDHNPEVIFEIVYIQGDKNYSSGLARGNQPKGLFTLSRNKSTGDGRYVNLDLVREYEPGDLRKDWNIQLNPNVVSETYYCSKYRDNGDAAGDLGYGGNNWILMRYGDIALLLAESEMLLGNETEAVRYIDMIRKRAGLPSYEESCQDPSYSNLYPTLKLALLHERRAELAFECHRWYDLLRFFTPSELVTYMHAKDPDGCGISNLRNFTEADRLYPIPFDEWKLNPEKMYQNPGYGSKE